MNKSAPQGGAGSDESHRAMDLWQDSPSGTPWPGVVRTSFSNADALEFCPTTGSATSQSERGLDSADPSPDGERSARASGISDRQGAPPSSCAGLSAGWREVSYRLSAEEGQSHE